MSNLAWLKNSYFVRENVKIDLDVADAERAQKPSWGCQIRYLIGWRTLSEKGVNGPTNLRKKVFVDTKYQRLAIHLKSKKKLKSS